jgi:ATP phosphoribosyltransferase
MSTPSNGPLILALPSKGRLKEQCEEWLAQSGRTITAIGGGRGYSAVIDNLPDISVQFHSASAIAGALEAGEVHLGVTGEDLLRERGEHIDARVRLLQPLGFGKADVVVAAPEAWIDVATMADVDDVAHDFLARTGGRLRVATKYFVLTRSFFAAHGIVDYRIVASAGATEGAPAAGAAELIVDITTTGATLIANQLKILDDGVILKSQANLAASKAARWSKANLASARTLLGEGEAMTRLADALGA